MGELVERLQTENDNLLKKLIQQNGVIISLKEQIGRLEHQLKREIDADHDDQGT